MTGAVEPGAVEPGTEAAATRAVPEVIRVEDVWFRYPAAELPALRGVDLTVRRGEMLGVIGPSGAGKSTLCQALKGLIPHSTPGEIEGRVLLHGQDVTSAPNPAASARAGLVLQDPEAQIIGMTVAEDLAFGPENYEVEPDVIAERSRRCLRLVGLPESISGQDTYALSGGQKQRLAIASALMTEPDVLILDEPTSELDPRGKDTVFEVVAGLRAAAAVTVVLVEHDVDRLARLADRIIVLSDGEIVGAGTPQEIFSGPDMLERTAGERVPAAVELPWRLERGGTMTGLPLTFELGEALDHIVSRLPAAPS